jgi:hypothetical protein
MDDPLLVRGLERVRDLSCDRERFIDRHRASRNTLREVLAFDEFHHEGGRAPGFLEPVERSDAQMIQRREHFRLALKPREAIGLGSDRRRQDLDRDLAFQPGVGRTKHLPHPALANLRGDVIHAETRAGSEGQVAGLYGSDGQSDAGALTIREISAQCWARIPLGGVLVECHCE